MFEKFTRRDSMEKLNIAIADDNERMVRLLGDIVRSDEELQVIGTAKDGVEAYELIKTAEPDVVLLDIVMPKMDGLGVMEKVNKDLRSKAPGIYYDQCDWSGKDYRGCIPARSRLLYYETVRQ